MVTDGLGFLPLARCTSTLALSPRSDRSRSGEGNGTFRTVPWTNSWFRVGAEPSAARLSSSAGCSAGGTAVPGGAGAGPSGRGEARAEHVTTARGAGRAVPRGGSGGESNGGRGRLRAGRAAGAAAAEARRAGTFPGRLSSVITPCTVAPGETAGERPSVAGTDNGFYLRSGPRRDSDLARGVGSGSWRRSWSGDPIRWRRGSVSSGPVRSVRARGSPRGTCRRAAPRELAESVGPAQSCAPSRALSGSRVPGPEPDLGRQEQGRGPAQPGPHAALLCLTSAEPMRTNSCCPSSDEPPV